jgi:hypothetical protein
MGIIIAFPGEKRSIPAVTDEPQSEPDPAITHLQASLNRFVSALESFLDITAARLQGDVDNMRRAIATLDEYFAKTNPER